MDSFDYLIEAEIAKCEFLSMAFSNTPSRAFLTKGNMAVFSDGTTKYQTALELIKTSIRDLDDSKYRDIRADYTAICCGTRTNDPLPYKSIYEGPERLLMRNCCISLAQQYGELGFSPEKEDSNEPEDFLPTMLKCLSYQYKSAINKRRQDGYDAYKAALTTSKRFKQDNIDSWIPLYCIEALPLVSTNYYQGVLLLLNSFAVQENRI